MGSWGGFRVGSRKVGFVRVGLRVGLGWIQSAGVMIGWAWVYGGFSLSLRRA